MVPVYLPDRLYQLARQVAERRSTSTDKVLGEALEEYLQRHENGPEALNRALHDADLSDSGFANAAARRILGQAEW